MIALLTALALGQIVGDGWLSASVELRVTVQVVEAQTLTINVTEDADGSGWAYAEWYRTGGHETQTLWARIEKDSDMVIAAVDVLQLAPSIPFNDAGIMLAER